MIFNKEFDKSLWLILKSDKKNREGIIEFVKSIPSELYEQIYIQLEKYKECEEGKIDIFDLDDFCLRGECLNQLNRKYSFVVDIINNSITITRSVPICGEYEDAYELTLCASSRYNNINTFGKQMLGNFTNYIQKSDIEYDLVNTLFGMMVIYSNNTRLKKCKKIAVNDIPEDVRMMDLSDREGISRVRKMN